MNSDRDDVAAVLERVRQRVVAHDAPTGRLIGALTSRRAVFTYLLAFCAGAIVFLLLGAAG